MILLGFFLLNKLLTMSACIQSLFKYCLDIWHLQAVEKGFFLNQRWKDYSYSNGAVVSGITCIARGCIRSALMHLLDVVHVSNISLNTGCKRLFCIMLMCKSKAICKYRKTDRVVDSAAPEERKNTEFMKGIPHSENSLTHTHTKAKNNWSSWETWEYLQNTLPNIELCKTFSVEHEEMLITNDFLKIIPIKISWSLFIITSQHTLFCKGMYFQFYTWECLTVIGKHKCKSRSQEQIR